MFENNRVSVIIAAAGSGKRMGGSVPKQFLELLGIPVLVRAVKAFAIHPMVDDIFVAARNGMVEHTRRLLAEEYKLPKITQVLAGGQERQDSVFAAIKAIGTSGDCILVHDGARPFVNEQLITDVIRGACMYGAAVPGVIPKDTIKIRDGRQLSGTLDRNSLLAVQTPQGFLREILFDAYAKAGEEGCVGTDDAVLVERTGKKVYVIEGSYNNIKITTEEDMAIGQALAGRIRYRTGSGLDVHKVVPGRKLVLGGVEIPWEKGLLGHSDADVLTHAVIDALLGAAGLGDIGMHFPDSDQRYKDINSTVLLTEVLSKIKSSGFEIENIDGTVIAERPKLAPYKEAMEELLAEVLGIDKDRVNIKATTTETLGFCGREEGIAAMAQATVYRMEERV